MDLYEHGKFVPWSCDGEFKGILAKITGRTVVDIFRLYTLYQLAKSTVRVKGDCAEVGVWRGGTLKIIAEVMPMDKAILGYDTFDGMPDSIEGIDAHRSKDFDLGKDGGYEYVKRLFEENDNVELIGGVFPGSAVGQVGKVFSFVHVDCDIYRSVLDCCKFFCIRMSEGGIIVFDDYGFESCRGAKKAVDEYCDQHDIRFVYLPTGQGVMLF